MHLSHPESRALVLIAEDDPATLKALSGVLAADGLDVAVAANGKEVLEMVAGELPDLILLDGLMPGVDGFETCKRLKADPVTQDIPVIFMTSLTETNYRVLGFSVGAVDYVTKPIERAELLARVRTQISLRSATRALQAQNARLIEEIRERVAAEEKFERRTEELNELNAQLSAELQQREQTEAERASLAEQIIAVQRRRLLELAAPLIPITEQILVMPLVGTMDEERAAQAIETALRGASANRADCLIIDITGVLDVDIAVAQMLFRAVQGLRLLGTRAIITGILPKVAQMFVTLDLRFDALVTKATLKDGVEYALQTRGRGFERDNAR